LKALAILAIIIVSLIPVYLLYKYLQKMIRPKDSAVRLFLYLFAGFALVFVYTFLVVLIIKKIFPGA
jgi:cytochrome c biogenesis protein CcdA